MEYEASNRIQIRGNPEDPNELVYHEDRGDGTPLCGTVNRDWNGRPMQYASEGPGPVTCGSCARIVSQDRREREEAEADRRRALEEEADRAERVRKIRESGARLSLPDLDASLRRRRPTG